MKFEDNKFLHKSENSGFYNGKMDVNDYSFKPNICHKNEPEASNYNALNYNPIECKISSKTHLRLTKLRDSEECWTDQESESTDNLSLILDDESGHDSGLSLSCDSSFSTLSGAGMPIDFSEMHQVKFFIKNFFLIIFFNKITNFKKEQNVTINSFLNSPKEFNVSLKEKESFFKIVRKVGKNHSSKAGSFGIRNYKKSPRAKFQLKNKIQCIIEEETTEFSFLEAGSSASSSATKITTKTYTITPPSKRTKKKT